MKRNLKVKFILILLLFAAALVIALLPSFKSAARADSESPVDYIYDNGRMQIDVDENKILHIKENLNIGFMRNQTYFERRVAGKTKSVKNVDGRAKKGRSFLAEITVIGAKIDGVESRCSVNRNGSNNYIRIENDGSFKKWSKDRKSVV